MKVMWMTFAPIGRAAEILCGNSTQSGGWVDATLNGLLPYIADKRMELEIVALDSNEKRVVDEKTGVTFRTVNVARNRGKRGCAEEKAKLKALIDEFSPDVIQIWGTEFTFGLDVIEVAGDVPVCFYIQGVMESLVKHPLGDVPAFSLFLKLGISSIFKFRSLKKWQRINAKHVALENEMVARSAGLIVDNEWTCAQYERLTSKFYFVPLASNSCFSEKKWDVGECERHTLFTVAGGICPQKGVHDAVLAVARLKEKYPDIKLYIPGAVSSRTPKFLFDSVFIRHIRKIIDDNNLHENVRFTGRLSPSEMAQRMVISNAFVMPSCVETHSSSLREAMHVGVPSVSADVGSVPEFLHHGKNGFLYRYGEVQTLAHYIDKIFSDDVISENIGKNAKQTIEEVFPQGKIGELLFSAYRQMIEGGKGNE